MKKNCHREDFVIPAGFCENESEKMDKYLDLAWELKKLWNMMMITTVVSDIGMVLGKAWKRLAELEIIIEIGKDT